MCYGYAIQFVTTYCSSDRRDRGPKNALLTLTVTGIEHFERDPEGHERDARSRAIGDPHEPSFKTRCDGYGSRF
jgi:hypothetical protein